MTLLLIGLALFFGAHLFSAFRSRVPGKDLKARMGAGPYMALYSIVSLAGFVLIIKGYGQMRPSPVLFNAPEWGRPVAMVLMLFSLVFLTASQIPAGHIKKRLKHPMLLAVKLWALGHLLANGELNAVLLFGTFLAYAIIDRIAVKRRGDVGAALAAPNVKWDVISLLVGFGIYAALIIALHPILFGVPVY